MQVTLRRDNQANTPVSTYFAKVMGIDEINVSATTVAFRGYPAKVPTGTVQLPIVIIGESILGGDGCPTCDKTKPLDAVAGWTSFTTYPNNSTTVVDYLNGHSTIPDVKVGDIVYLNGDSISNSYFSNAYNYVKALFNENGVDTTGDHKADYWEVVLPVVKQTVSASNQGQPWAQRALAKMRRLFAVQPAYACGPTTGHQVSGFVTVKLTKLNNSDHSKASATVICDVVQPGSTTGGGDFGSRAATAKLIR